MKVITIALLAAALAATGAGAFELCDVHGKSAEFYASVRPLRKLLEAKKFGELDSKMGAMIADQQAGRLSDALLHRAFSSLMNANASWEPLLREWAAQFPRSQAARLALGYYFSARAWAARGGEFSYKTSGEQFTQMESYFKTALAYYDEADARGRKLSVAAGQRINMAGTTPALDVDPDQLYRDGIRAYPGSLELRIHYIEKSAPKWDGSIEQLEAIPGDAKALSEADRRYLQYLVYQEIGNAYWCRQRWGCRGGSPADARRAVEYLEKSIPLCPGLDESLDYLMRFHEEHKDYAALVATASRAIERNPRNADAFYMRGEAYGNSRRFKEGFADIERATQLGHAYAFKELAWFYETGNVVPRDVRKAIDLYMIADARKVDGARRAAERLGKSSAAAPK